MVIFNSEKYRVAVISYLNDPVRMPSSAFDRLYSWSDYDPSEAAYFDASQSEALWLLKLYSPDIIVLDSTLLRRRWSSSEISLTSKFLESISKLNKFTIAAPLDEPNRPDVLEYFYKSAGVRRVLTCAQDEDIPKLYVNMFNKLEFIQVLPTLMRASLEKRFRQHNNWAKRKNDVGYRGYFLDDSFDEKSKLKQNLALAIARFSNDIGLNVSISLEPADLILSRGSWAKWLNDSKIVCGAESGMSKIICACSSDIRNGNKVDYLSISSRHIEAALSNCCQLLIDGNYSDILKADVDYISINSKFNDVELKKKIKFALECGSEDIRKRAFQTVISDERLKINYYAARALQGLPKRAPSISLSLRRTFVRLAFIFRLLTINLSRVAWRAKVFFGKERVEI